MATIAEGGLFPPIIQSYLPAFNISTVRNEGLSIDYNVSDYNSFSDILSVHVSITRQSNYHSLFNKSTYPIGIWVKNISVSDVNQTITIPSSALNPSELSYNEYYKVQIRLSKISYNGSIGTALSAYLNNESNLANFSEWSTVCLIRFIAPPVFSLDGNGHTLTTSGSNTIIVSSLTISGVYSKQKDVTAFPTNNNIKNGLNDLEYLSSYKVQVIKNNETVFDSGIRPVDIHNPTAFMYQIPYYFEHNVTAVVRVSYITANLYEAYNDYPILPNYSKSSWNLQEDVREITSVDTVIGKTNISFSPMDGETPIPAGGHLTIRRGSDKDNFAYWETIWNKNIVAATVGPISFDDFTIESGVLYKYEITYTKANNSSYFTIEGPVISVFDHAFLTGEGTQLCVKFNPSLSSYRHNVADNIVTTIGGKYPYITRNSSMNYRSFTLTGTIAYEMDAEHQFTSRSAIYGPWVDIYGTYFVNHYFNQANDRITQRKFREMVENYLYSDVPKLFRSTPEGNVLVRVTDVSLTPNNQLARMIYDFSCTVTEIGDCTVENYRLYNIQDFGD